MIKRLTTVPPQSRPLVFNRVDVDLPPRPPSPLLHSYDLMETLTARSLQVVVFVVLVAAASGASGQVLSSTFDVLVSLPVGSPSEAGSTCADSTTNNLLTRLDAYFGVDSAGSNLFQTGTGAVYPAIAPSGNNESLSCITRIFLTSANGDGANPVTRSTLLTGCCISNMLRETSTALLSTSVEAQHLAYGALSVLLIDNLTEVPNSASDFPLGVATCASSDPSTYCSSTPSNLNSPFVPATPPKTVLGDTSSTTFDASVFFGTRNCVDFFTDPDSFASLPSSLATDTNLITRRGSSVLNTTSPLRLCTSADMLTSSSTTEFTFAEPTSPVASATVGSAPSVYNMASAMSVFLYSWTAELDAAAASREDYLDPANVRCAQHYAAFGQFGLLRVGKLARNANATAYTPSYGLTCASLLNTTRFFSHPTVQGSTVAASPFTYTLSLAAGTSVATRVGQLQSALDTSLLQARNTTPTARANATYFESIVVKPLWLEPAAAEGRSSTLTVGLEYAITPSSSSMLSWEDREMQLPLYDRDVFHNCIGQQGVAANSNPTPSPPDSGRATRDFPLMWVGAGISIALALFMAFVVYRRPRERQDPLGSHFDKSLLTEAIHAAESNMRFQESGGGGSSKTRRTVASRDAPAIGLDKPQMESEMTSVVNVNERREPDEGGEGVASGTRYFAEEYAKDLPEGMVGGGAVVLHNKSVPSYRQAMFDRKYEGPKPETSVGKGGHGKKVEQAEFDRDDNGNPYAAVVGDSQHGGAASANATGKRNVSPALPGQEVDVGVGSPTSPAPSVKRLTPLEEGKALFADSASATIMRTGAGTGIIVADDAFAGGGRRVKAAAKKSSNVVADDDDPFGGW